MLDGIGEFDVEHFMNICGQDGGKMIIEKDYYSLSEILKRWSIHEDDLIYLAENDEVRLSLRLCNLFMEFGTYEGDDEGALFRVAQRECLYSGLVDLRADDVFHLFRSGEAYLQEFRLGANGYAALPDTHEGHYAVIGDLLMRRSVRDHFEVRKGFHSGEPKEPERTFISANGYREIRFCGQYFQFGPIQAEVVRVLHHATEVGQPWQNGKLILSQAGSRSLKMLDVFKSKPGWRDLIQSDGRGNYRLRAD